jgi:hypothetical protein
VVELINQGVLVIAGEVEAAWSLWDRLKKLWDSKKRPPQESVATRFVRLFESHGVHRNQIPRFIGHGLTLKDVKDDATLLERLDEVLLEAACTKFAVRREWLDGAEEQVHPLHYFYKEPEAFCLFIDRLSGESPDGQLDGVVLAVPEAKKDPSALIILQEIVGFVGEKPIYRYHLLSDWSYSYWKSRAYLTACVAIAWKKQIHLRGRMVAAKEIESLFEGTCLLGWGGEGSFMFRGRHWYPEDMALEPDVFLEGVDPERENFGIRSALKLWLELDTLGHMDIGLKQGEARPKFERRLNQMT